MNEILKGKLNFSILFLIIKNLKMKPCLIWPLMLGSITIRRCCKNVLNKYFQKYTCFTYESGISSTLKRFALSNSLVKVKSLNS